MKKIKYFITGVLILFFSYGCSEDFMERYPYGALSPDKYYKTASEAEYAVNSCYTQLRFPNNFWASGYRIFGNYLCDDLSQNSRWPDLQQGNITPSDWHLVDGVWVRAYPGIARCNTAIEGIENMTDDMIDPEEKSARLGEARFIRGWYYFRLVRLYGDVPLILAPVDASDDASLYPTRTAAADVYSQGIIPDMEFAAANCPTSYDSPDDANRITSGAANAFLCLVHLNLDNWTEAETFGKAVVNSGEYLLLDDFEKINHEFYEFNKESIFEISYNRTYMNWNNRYYGTLEGNFVRGGIYTTHSFTSMDLRDAFTLIDGSDITDDPIGIYNPDEFWKNRDPRFDFSYFTPLDTLVDKSGNTVGYDINWVFDKNALVDFQKHVIYYGEDIYNTGLNMIEMRYAEHLLNLAEALIMQDKFTEAATYINQVRARARNYALADPGRYNPNGLAPEQVMPDITISDRDDGMKKLRYEKRVELAVEDERGYDLRRWGIEEQTWAAVQGFTWDDKFKLLPMPQSALDQNPNLTQNTGY
ncbi:MAG: RagB/SusD family nutrient uptake outer membrane protein [Bacteroidota bacterium]